MLPLIYPSPQSKWHLDRLSCFCTADGRVSGMAGHVLPLKIAPSNGGGVNFGPASNTCFLGPTQVHNLNGISIGSAIFAQMTAQCPYTVQWATPSPLKIAPSHPMGDVNPHLIHGSLGPPESSTQTASQLVRPFLRGSLL